MPDDTTTLDTSTAVDTSSTEATAPDIQSSDAGTSDTAAPDTGTDTSTPADTGADSTTSPAPVTQAQPMQSEAATRKTVPAPARSPSPTHNPNQPTPKVVVDPQREAGKWGSEKQRYEEQIGEMNRRLQAFEQQQTAARAEAAKMQLKPWHPSHPERTQSMDRINRVKSYLGAVSALQNPTPEQQSALQRQFRVTKEDASLHDEFEDNKALSLSELASDPDGYVESKALTAVRRELQTFAHQMHMHQQAKVEVDRLLGDQDKISRHKEFIQTHLSQKIPLKTVMEMVDMKEELAALKGTVQTVDTRTQQVSTREQANQERDRLRKSQATLTRDQQSAGVGVGNIYDRVKKEAAAEGFEVGGSLFNSRIRKYEVQAGIK